MKRVCHVIFEHHPLDARVFYKESLSLVRRGYEVHVLAPSVDGKTMGVKREIRQYGPAALDNVTIHPWSYPKRRVPKTFNLRFRVALADLRKRMEAVDADIYFFHENNFTMDIIPGYKQSHPDIKIVFDFHEFHLNRLRIKRECPAVCAEYLVRENRVLKACDLFLTVSDFNTEYYSMLTDKPVVTIYNAQARSVFPDLPHCPDPSVLTLVHEGRMLFDRGLREVVEAAVLLKGEKVKFLFVGEMHRSEIAFFEEMDKRHGIAGMFEITGMLPYVQVPAQLARADAGLLLVTSRNSRTGLSNKFFNYVRYGIPIISWEGIYSDSLVRNLGLGVLVKQNPGALAGAIRHFARHREELAPIREKVGQAYERELNWDLMEDRLTSALESLF